MNKFDIWHDPRWSREYKPGLRISIVPRIQKPTLLQRLFRKRILDHIPDVGKMVDPWKYPYARQIPSKAWNSRNTKTDGTLRITTPKPQW